MFAAIPLVAKLLRFVCCVDCAVQKSGRCTGWTVS